ncbi:hypothetical protein OF83DRAFT_344395 [Amylostereum chailletii]|nr:hypothetical protein OF83DRAFT_344395 [Amylostereum chailletii]
MSLGSQSGSLLLAILPPLSFLRCLYRLSFAFPVRFYHDIPSAISYQPSVHISLTRCPIHLRHKHPSVITSQSFPPIFRLLSPGLCLLGTFCCLYTSVPRTRSPHAYLLFSHVSPFHTQLVSLNSGESVPISAPLPLPR